VMTGSLHAYFQGRGIELTSVEHGTLTPVRFTDPVEEHRATRRMAGLFDFSFMGCFEITGAQAAAFLARVQTRNLSRLRPGRLLYTLLLRGDGSVFNDATVWDLGDGRYWIITGRPGDRAHLQQLAQGLRVSVTDMSGQHAVLAVQGPASHRIMASMVGESNFSLPYFGFHDCMIFGCRAWVARAGYSGEAGYEILVAADQGRLVWETIVQRFAASGLAECGLEAIDTLRVEAGLILFLRELAWRVTPRMLRLGRLLDPPGVFHGAPVLRGPAARNDQVRLAGLVPGRDPLPPPALPVAHAGGVLSVDRGRVVITSRAFSPNLGRTHGLGFVHVEDAYPGTAVTTVDGTRVTVARLPFYDPPKRRPRQ
jgi:aminomethyltransferase